MSNKTWQDYLSEIGKTSRPDSDRQLDLPTESWAWGSLGEKNRTKILSSRAHDLDLWSYFLTDPEDYTSTPDVRKVSSFFPDDSTRGHKVFKMLHAFRESATAAQTTALLEAAMKPLIVSPTLIKEEQKNQALHTPPKSVSNSEQFKIRMEKFK